MARFAAVCALALLAVGCSGASEGSNAVGEVVLEREDGVYMVDLASGEERRLGSVARFGGSWSPSGTKAAIDEGDTIVVTTIATGARERLVAPQCSLPVWAPDEKMLACSTTSPGSSRRSTL